MKGDYQKLLKQLTLFFLSNPALFNGQSHQKERGPGTSDHSLFGVQNKFTKISYMLTDQVWWFNIKRFLSYSKNYTCKFMQANSWHHKLFHLHLFFESGKCGKEWEKLHKFEYIEKKHFSLFFKSYHLVKK